MKKVILATLLAGLMATGLSAFDGKIGSIQGSADTNKVRVELVLADSSTKSQVLVGSADMIKTNLAIILTAKSTNADVTVYPAVVGGVWGWKTIVLK